MLFWHPSRIFDENRDTVGPDNDGRRMYIHEVDTTSPQRMEEPGSPLIVGVETALHYQSIRELTTPLLPEELHI